jgi:hypothetical protein
VIADRVAAVLAKPLSKVFKPVSEPSFEMSIAEWPADAATIGNSAVTPATLIVAVSVETGSVNASPQGLKAS